MRDKHFKSLVTTAATCKTDVNGWFTPQDEALALVLFENGIHSWRKDFEKRYELADENAAGIMKVKLSKKDKSDLPPHKYTQRKSGSSTLLKGWSVEGLIRYSDLVKSCLNFRQTNIFDEFSNHAVDLLQNRKLLRTTKKKERDLSIDEDAETAKRLKTLFNEDTMNITFSSENTGNYEQEEVNSARTHVTVQQTLINQHQQPRLRDERTNRHNGTPVLSRERERLRDGVPRSINYMEQPTEQSSPSRIRMSHMSRVHKV